MTIAITGATGQLGQLVIAQLIPRVSSSNIIALVRDPAKAEHIQQQGIELRSFDYSQSADQLQQQLAGIETLLLISSSEVGQRIQQHQHVIDAAKQAGVKRLVYTSILAADQSPLALAEEHLATEKLITASGLDYVLLRNGWYNENYAMGLSQAVQQGAIYGATHHGKISSASRLDYATAAAVVLSDHQHRNAIYELAGDESYTLDDVAQWTSEIANKNIVYQDLSEDEYQSALVQAGLPDVFAHILANSDEGASKGGLYHSSQQLSQLIGRPTTPMKDTITTFLP